MQIWIEKDAHLLVKNILNNQIVNSNNNNTIELICKYCNKKYSRKDVLIRHINLYCKEKFKHNNDNKIVEQLLEENKEINEILNKLKEENKELKQLSIGKSSKINTSKNINNVQTNSHNTTNVNSNNNIANIQNNNFIVNFGSEDMSKLTDVEILESVKTLDSVFTSFIKTVHANKRLPQFSNLQINNLRSNHSLMMEEGIFVSKTFPQIIEELKNTRLPDIEYFAKKFKDNKKLTMREYNSINTSVEFLKNYYIETEDVEK